MTRWNEGESINHGADCMSPYNLHSTVPAGKYDWIDSFDSILTISCSCDFCTFLFNYLFLNRLTWQIIVKCPCFLLFKWLKTSFKFLFCHAKNQHVAVLLQRFDSSHSPQLKSCNQQQQQECNQLCPTTGTKTTAIKKHTAAPQGPSTNTCSTQPNFNPNLKITINKRSRPE